MTFLALLRNIFFLYGVAVYLLTIVGYFGIRAGELTSTYVFSSLVGFTAFIGIATGVAVVVEIMSKKQGE